ncbi:hypothetical protein HPB47_019435, partial [Ixodes persulcatus]
VDKGRDCQTRGKRSLEREATKDATRREQEVAKAAADRELEILRLRLELENKREGNHSSGARTDSEALRRLPPADAADYGKIKSSLKRFWFTVEGFRDKFWDGKPVDGETATQDATAVPTCQRCGRKGHTTEVCWGQTKPRASGVYMSRQNGKDGNITDGFVEQKDGTKIPVVNA